MSNRGILGSVQYWGDLHPDNNGIRTRVHLDEIAFDRYAILSSPNYTIELPTLNCRGRRNPGLR